MIYTNRFNEDKAVARLAELTALECGTAPAVARQIRTASALHDIGKVKIPQSIINKPGKLTPEEFEIIKTHTTLGAEMLASFQGELGAMAKLIALYHHERCDCCGYWGKDMNELPQYVAITAIADVFTALVCKRAYKEAWPPDEAIAYILSQAGRQFNPALVDAFIQLVRYDDRAWAIFNGR
ncbi:MAG: HD domain-containing protein [Oscillospiraceae bacterium]|nr:HD domain-containing protein [Oscillospiraceae bacterium]